MAALFGAGQVQRACPRLVHETNFFFVLPSSTTTCARRIPFEPWVNGSHALQFQQERSVSPNACSTGGLYKHCTNRTGVSCAPSNPHVAEAHGRKWARGNRPRWCGGMRIWPRNSSRHMPASWTICLMKQLRTQLRHSRNEAGKKKGLAVSLTL